MLRNNADRANAENEAREAREEVTRLLTQANRLSHAKADRIDVERRHIEELEAMISEYDRAHMSATPGAPKIVPGWHLGSGTTKIADALYTMRMLAFPENNQRAFAKELGIDAAAVSRHEARERDDFKISSLATWASRCKRAVRTVFLPLPEYNQPRSLAALGFEAAVLKYYYGPTFAADALKRFVERLREVVHADCVMCYVAPPSAEAVYLFHAVGARDNDALWVPLHNNSVPFKLIGQCEPRFVEDVRRDEEFESSQFRKKENICSAFYVPCSVRFDDSTRQRLLFILNYRAPQPKPTAAYCNELKSLSDMLTFMLAGAHDESLSGVAIHNLEKNLVRSPVRREPLLRMTPEVSLLLEGLANKLSNDLLAEEKPHRRFVITLHMVSGKGRDTKFRIVASYPLVANNDVEMGIESPTGFLPRLFQKASEDESSNAVHELLIEDMDAYAHRHLYEPLPPNLQFGDLKTKSEYALVLYEPNTSRIWAILNAESPDKGAFNATSRAMYRRSFTEYAGRLWWEFHREGSLANQAN